MTVKRFIAGAICPQCNMMDTVRVFRVLSGKLHRECVDCEFVDSVIQDSFLSSSPTESPIIREEKVLGNDIEIIRFIDE